jgi:hydrogenase expression/formation protein HypC
MCLSIPARIDKIDGEMAHVTVGEASYKASLQLLDNVKEGDYVLLHTGFAIQKISKEEAEETMKLFEEFEEMNKELDREEEETGRRIV